MIGEDIYHSDVARKLTGVAVCLYNQIFAGGLTHVVGGVCQTNNGYELHLPG